jgi:hypothetical protein
MTDKERELIELIRNHSDPAKAFEVAVSVILDFLKRSESISVQAAVDLQERA